MSSTAHASLKQEHSWLARTALVALTALAFVLLTGWIDGGVGVAPMRVFDQPIYVLANALPGLLLAGLLLALTRRLLLSFALALLVENLVFAINALKVANLGTPLIPADFQMVGQLDKGGSHVLGAYLPHSPWPYLAILAGIAAIVLLWRHEPRLFAQRTRGRRLAAGSIIALLLATQAIGSPGWRTLYNAHQLWLEPWSASSTATHSGLFSSLMLYHLQYGHGAQKPDPAAARQLLGEAGAALRARLQVPPDSATDRPDIVVVQSESFFDPRIMKGFEHTDLTPNLQRLAAHGEAGALHVPTFGGGTIRTEFEMLTGLSLRYFPALQFPYLQLNAKVVPGLVRTLRAHGYETVAIHGNDPSFWNRTSAFRAIGFDRFVSQKAFPANAPNDGKYMADRAMTDEILTQLKDSGPPQFLFAISIEGHGPYDTQPTDVAARDAIAVPAAITGEDKLEMQNYLYHIGHADQQLGRLAAELAKRDRPTLLLFYGDHLPALTNAFHATGFVNGGDMLSQPGTWLLIDPRSTAKPVREDLAAWMLPGKLLDMAGIHDDAYFTLTQWLTPQLAALTRAPGAPPVAEDASEKRVDRDMASVAMLRLDGKLEPLLDAPMEVAEREPETPQAAASGSHYKLGAAH